MKCRTCGTEQGLDKYGNPRGLSRDFDNGTCVCVPCWEKQIEEQANQ